MVRYLSSFDIVIKFYYTCILVRKISFYILKYKYFYFMNTIVIYSINYPGVYSCVLIILI